MSRDLPLTSVVLGNPGNNSGEHIVGGELTVTLVVGNYKNLFDHRGNYQNFLRMRLIATGDVKVF